MIFCHVPMPPHSSKIELSNEFGAYFIKKIDIIRQFFTESPDIEEMVLTEKLPCMAELSAFEIVSHKQIQELIMSTPAKSCELDPLPTWLLKLSLKQLIPIITEMVNTSLTECSMTNAMKTAVVKPLLKKAGLPLEWKNYRPVSNLTYISKQIERVIAKQIVKHIELNNLPESFQSAHKTYHSTETALVRVKNDIIRSIAEKEVTLLILLDLSAAFDTVDHTILLDRVKNQMGITGDVHRWLCSYLSDRTQYVFLSWAAGQKQPNSPVVSHRVLFLAHFCLVYIHLPLVTLYQNMELNTIYMPMTPSCICLSNHLAKSVLKMHLRSWKDASKTFVHGCTKTNLNSMMERQSIFLSGINIKHPKLSHLR